MIVVHSYEESYDSSTAFVVPVRGSLDGARPLNEVLAENHVSGTDDWEGDLQDLANAINETVFYYEIDEDGLEQEAAEIFPDFIWTGDWPEGLFYEAETEDETPKEGTIKVVISRSGDLEDNPGCPTWLVVVLLILVVLVGVIVGSMIVSAIWPTELTLKSILESLSW